jgi:hypothetical protein
VSKASAKASRMERATTTTKLFIHSWSQTILGALATQKEAEKEAYYR